MKFSAGTLALAAVLAASSSLLGVVANYCPKNIAVQLNSLNQGSTPSSSATAFNAASESVRNAQFFAPSQDLATSIGASLDITHAQLYDAAIQFGADALTKSQWLNRFLQERLDSSKTSASNTAGVKTYQSLINQKQYNWGNSVEGPTIGKRNIIIWC
ncbi:hypothetical protein DL89DRAFT_281924 [Linderina pennispora]|uniref:SCP domain-containing protein n=1 Tax=Linderina pennispora TaxID=61395 RepID=A0A1Y1WIN5_9FUNG|nr:uncharacterized protein DL89DRAFT_281924 [Linderina pennispora]ORX73342.1 hypothetical protein DL89DRAFT_281924 [Linderina pennispora]